MRVGEKIFYWLDAILIAVMFGIWQDSYKAGECCWAVLMFAVLLTSEIIDRLDKILSRNG